MWSVDHRYVAAPRDMITIDRVPLLTQAELDELPQGIIELDPADRSVGLNQIESRSANRSAADMIG